MAATATRDADRDDAIDHDRPLSTRRRADGRMHATTPRSDAVPRDANASRRAVVHERQPPMRAQGQRPAYDPREPDLDDDGSDGECDEACLRAVLGIRIRREAHTRTARE